MKSIRKCVKYKGITLLQANLIFNFKCYILVTLFIRDNLANFLHVKCSSMWRRFATNPSSFLYSINALLFPLCNNLICVPEKRSYIQGDKDKICPGVNLN